MLSPFLVKMASLYAHAGAETDRLSDEGDFKRLKQASIVAAIRSPPPR